MHIKNIGLVPARLDHIRLKCDALVLGTLFVVTNASKQNLRSDYLVLYLLHGKSSIKVILISICILFID